MSRFSVFWRGNYDLPYGVETRFTIEPQYASGPAGTGSSWPQHAFLMFREDEILTNDFE
jgi:hypothetical protein